MTVRDLAPDPDRIADDLEQRARARRRRRPSRWPADDRRRQQTRRRRGLTPDLAHLLTAHERRTA